MTFKPGDTVHRKSGTTNGTYRALVLEALDPNTTRYGPTIRVQVTEVISRGSGDISPGMRLTLSPNKFLLWRRGTPKPAGAAEMDHRFAVRAAKKRDCGKTQQALVEANQRALALERKVGDAEANLYAEQRRARRLLQENRDLKRQRDQMRGVSGVPRKLLIVLTPPGVEPSESAASGIATRSNTTVLTGEMDMIVAASVDDSYVKVLQSRYAAEADTEVFVRWAAAPDA